MTSSRAGFRFASPQNHPDVLPTSEILPQDKRRPLYPRPSLKLGLDLTHIIARRPALPLALNLGTNFWPSQLTVESFSAPPPRTSPPALASAVRQQWPLSSAASPISTLASSDLQPSFLPNSPTSTLTQLPCCHLSGYQSLRISWDQNKF